MATKQYLKQRQRDAENKKVNAEKIKDKIKRIMREHVGRKNAIRTDEFFKLVYGLDAQELNIFELVFYWNVTKKLIRELRRNEECFIINSISSLYVLETYDELKNFNRRLDSTIKALQRLKVKGKNWVDTEKYRTF